MQGGEPVTVVVAGFGTPSFDQGVQGLDRGLEGSPGGGPRLERLDEESERLIVGLKNIQPNIAATIGGPVGRRHAPDGVGGLAGEGQDQLRPQRLEPRLQSGLCQTIGRGGNRRGKVGRRRPIEQVGNPVDDRAR